MIAATSPLTAEARELLSSSKFAGLPSEEFGVLSVDAGDCIYRRGDVADSMFVVLDGQAGLSCIGCEYPLCTYSPGEAFGEIDAMQGRPRSSATTAVTACRLIVVPASVVGVDEYVC